MKFGLHFPRGFCSALNDAVPFIFRHLGIDNIRLFGYARKDVRSHMHNGVRHRFYMLHLDTLQTAKQRGSTYTYRYIRACHLSQFA